ncbi:hypothetical protein NQ318_008695 [Aromia moschata]|uniref:DNA-directed DNA polymerase n=1 Tax=Aromia moschata TaxID=1265417 RepID=A0AAV8X731_9CUCU|nr:hypothetical protein NQ318_008695 [Aromia moschata]
MFQTKRAVELCDHAGVVIPEAGAGIPELQQFQRYLSEYKIVVYQYGNKGRDVIFQGGTKGPTINLLYHESHYNVITSLTAAFCCSYYCEECHVPYNSKNHHKCGGTCPACQQSPVCSKGVAVTCADCQRSFRGQQCYYNHKSSVCKEIYRCSDCFKVAKRGRKHTCGEIFCKICNTHVPSDHLCYMQPDAGKPKTADTLYVFYDLETRQEKQQQDGSLLHEPNLCVLASRCSTCISDGTLYFCQACGFRLIVYKDTVIKRFMKYLLGARQKFKQVVVIAHNGQAFDHQFILNYILTQTDLTPELIMRGTKIISMVVGNVKFLDSLNYFPMALSKLPKAFGLGDEFKKGYFPHLFNIEANANYEGDRAALIKWHNEKVASGAVFDFQKELVEYCVSDVGILTAACLKFREQLLDTGNVCPFTEACTIASACNKVYRRNFLKPSTIGIIPKGGYRCRDNQSKIATQWLVWEEKQREMDIIHSAKQQETRVAGVKVDGYCPDTNQVFEFHGCYYHGCPRCIKYRRNDYSYDDPTVTAESRHEATVAKTARLRGLGYEVIEMWECEFRRHLQKNEELRVYTENHPLVATTPLNPRDAFYGGRTGNTTEYYKCAPGEKIKYVDVCSLYPWVCKYGKFPVGHPKVHVGDNCKNLDLNQTDGLMNNKLMFVLCRTCGEELNANECRHNDEERILIGTWGLEEVKKALKRDTKCRRFTRCGPIRQNSETASIRVAVPLFHGRGKKRYVEEFLEREDVHLEYAEICENPGLRSLAKLILNSFWGKLGQRENQPKTSIVRTPEEFFGILTNPSIYVNSALPINEDTLVVNWGAQGGGLRLTSYSQRVTWNYWETEFCIDTDSVIYIARDNEYAVPTGEFLGDMTDELESYGPGSYITEFVSGGPKTMHTGCSLPETRRSESCARPVCITSRNILSTKEHEVITVQQTKMYKPLSTKRRFLDDHSSVPYGFKKFSSKLCLTLPALSNTCGLSANIKGIESSHGLQNFPTLKPQDMWVFISLRIVGKHQMNRKFPRSSKPQDAWAFISMRLLNVIDRCTILLAKDHKFRMFLHENPRTSSPVISPANVEANEARRIQLLPKLLTIAAVCSGVRPAGKYVPDFH